MSNRLTLTGDAAGECQWAEARRGVVRFGRTVRGSSPRDPLQDREIATFSVLDLEMMLDMARASRREVDQSLDEALHFHEQRAAIIRVRKGEARYG